MVCNIRYTNSGGGGDIELTEEHKTGYSYNGKPVYEIIKNLTTSSSVSSTGQITTIEENVEDLVFWSALCRTNNNSRGHIPSYLNSNDYIWCTMQVTEDNKLVFAERHTPAAYNHRPIDLLVRYTKIID